MPNLTIEVIVIRINRVGAHKDVWNRNIWESAPKPSGPPYYDDVTSSHWQAYSPQMCPPNLESSPFIKAAELVVIARTSEFLKLIVHLIKYFLFIFLEPTTNQLYEWI